jgi:hypothetical protein
MGSTVTSTNPADEINTHCYYACKPGEEYVHVLPKEKKWYDSISSIPKLQKECDAIARSTQRVPP